MPDAGTVDARSPIRADGPEVSERFRDVVTTGKPRRLRWHRPETITRRNPSYLGFDFIP
jgi:hypothetical protein